MTKNLPLKKPSCQLAHERGEQGHIKGEHCAMAPLLTLKISEKEQM